MAFFWKHPLMANRKKSSTLPFLSNSVETTNQYVFVVLDTRYVNIVTSVIRSLWKKTHIPTSHPKGNVAIMIQITCMGWTHWTDYCCPVILGHSRARFIQAQKKTQWDSPTSVWNHNGNCDRIWSTCLEQSAHIEIKMNFLQIFNRNMTMGK